MKKFGFTMVELLLVIAIVSLLAFCLPAMAADRGAQIQTTAVTTNSYSVAIPVSPTGRLTPTWLLMTGVPASCTQAVYWVASGVTGTVNAATTATAIEITNSPPMFYGDTFRVVPGSELTSNSISVKVIGTVDD